MNRLIPNASLGVLTCSAVLVSHVGMQHAKFYISHKRDAKWGQFLYNTLVNPILELEMGNYFGSIQCPIPQIKIFQDKGFGKIIIH